MKIHRLCEDNWKFCRLGAGNWYDARVPGTLFADMLDNHIIENPYYRFHEKQFAELAEEDYEYQCIFNLETEFLNREHQTLVFEGIDTIADIYLNGRKLASTDNMHRTYRFDVTGMLVAGCNKIEVILHSPLKYIREKHAENPLPEFNFASLHGFSQIRKIQSSFGWDAEPVVPDSGIWRDVYLEGYNRVRIEDVYVRQHHSEGTVELETEVSLDGRSDDCFEVCWQLEDPQQHIKAGGRWKMTGTKAVLHIPVDEPELWWPNGYGKQPLYKLHITVKYADSEETDSKEVRLGMRKAEVRREKDEWGESFAFYVNDVPVFAKGGCYTPPDKFLSHCRGERHRKLIQYCAESHYTCIRVWGGAVYPDDEFFDLCDEYGILIWQDLMFACALYPMSEKFADNICREVKDNVIRLRNHPSLMLWCGNNENEWFHDLEHDREGLTWELRMENLRQYEVYLSEVVKTYDKDRLYWPSSPSSGGGYIDPNGYERGDTHCWYVWYLPAKPYTFYRECQSRFVSEFGLESFQSVKTLQHYMEPEDMSPNSRVMDFMQRCSDGYCNMGNGKIMNYVFQEVKPPVNFKEYVFATQYAQAEGIKYGANHFRRLKPRCMGSLYWQIVDCFPGTTWSSIDYEYRWKILQYYAKRFYQETVVSIVEEGKKLALYVVHDGQKTFDASLAWQLRRNDGVTLLSGEKAIPVCANMSREVERLDFTGKVDFEQEAKCYLEFWLEDESGKELYRDTWLFVKPKHFRFLRPEVEWTVKETDEEFVIELRTNVYTKCIQLDLKKAEAVFSDNCFDLSPGQNKRVCVKRNDIDENLTLQEFQKQLEYQCVNTLGME